MIHAYYEPVKNKIYLSEWHVGQYPKFLAFATDGEYECSWYFTKDEYFFYYLGEI